MSCGISTILIVDSTFKNCPKYFYEFFIIHGLDGESFVLFFLIPNKETESYVRLFEHSTNGYVHYQLTLSPNVVFIDFEIATATKLSGLKLK